MLEQQVRRMLADPRRGLVTNFAGQWLHLRNLDSITPDLRLFPDFDDNLRQAFRRETELFFENVLREDRSVLDLLQGGLHVSQRTARQALRHSQCLRQPVPPGRPGRDSDRGGLLRQGSVLTVTSYATRTSPVIRGKWVLENLLGAPPPPPPPNVPALKDNTVSPVLGPRAPRRTPRQRRVRELPQPHGSGRLRARKLRRRRPLADGRGGSAGRRPGGLPDGSKFDGVAGLEAACSSRPELFVSTLTEKLLTFALGRGVETNDAPAVRAIVRRRASK